MKLFTVGPVQMYPETLQIEGTQLPYFRTPEFGDLMKDCEKWFLQSVYAPEGTGFAALTCSGTGAMDAAVANTLTQKDKALIINGGSFGKRFAEICELYKIPYDTYDIAFQEVFSKSEFRSYAGKGYTALLVNACDTSTGQKYDLDFLGAFCRENDMLFIVDAVSAYLADPINMEQQGIDVLFTASQKALSLSPGAALVALSKKAQLRAEQNASTYYFNFHSYLENQKRGQPPFTSAIGTMLALHQRLASISEKGVEEEIALHAERAKYFREKISVLPLQIPDIPLSNCCTPVLFPEKNATAVYESLKENYEIYLTPSGGDWKDLQLRVGHMGNLALEDFDLLVDLLGKELQK